ncbi:helix-turn-helix transcriptional regulator [Angustibacter sp. Root456]|uniref:helix-turn-helix domain-containing protein n=1 Tax=Angustibacter sp. Root456 TaxID=1736539 RepID=UPI0009E664D1
MQPRRDEEFAKVVVDVLREARLARGWSLERLGDEAGLHRTSIGLIERGKRRMTLDVAARLAWAVDMSLSEVVAAAEDRLLHG